MSDAGDTPALHSDAESRAGSTSSAPDSGSSTSTPRDHGDTQGSIVAEMRSTVQRNLREEIERASRLRYPLGLLVLLVVAPMGLPENPENDRSGPSIIGSIDSHLSTAIRSIDTLGQLDFSRLAVILPGTTARDLRAIGERLRIQTDLAAFLNHTIPAGSSLSVGGAVFPTHAYEEHEMLHVAEAACALSRESKLSRVVIGKARQDRRR